MANYEDRHKALVQNVEKLFSKKAPILMLWQEIAENFYPQRADFTYRRSLSTEFADNLTTSMPLLIHRDLANQISAMLRPPGQQYAHISTGIPENQLDNYSLRWLEDKTKVTFKAIQDRESQFTRATKETDWDFAAFGQGCISIEANLAKTTLLYRNWHLRDMAWCEAADGSIGLRARRWKPFAKDLYKLFNKNVHQNVINAVTMNNGVDAYKEVNVMHIIIPSDEYEYVAKNRPSAPWVSIYIDIDNKFVLEEMGRMTPYYIIPRWQTVSGSQYAYSPATVAALPDARLLQSITFTLLKAGEKAVDPPMIAVEEMVKSPIDIRAGGVIWVDADYDEKSGEVLRPMTTDGRGIPVGLNMQERLIQTLQSAFYLDKLALPQFGPEMTAYEVSQRLQEYIRQAIPLFEPIEEEYNSQVFDNTFQILMAVGAYGPPQEIPEQLQGQAVHFRFESPLIEAGDQKLFQTFVDASQLIATAAGLDPSLAKIIDAPVALRQALRGRQVPSEWILPEDQFEAAAEQMQQQQQAMQQAQIAEQAGNAGEAMGNAANSMAQAQLTRNQINGQ